MQRQKEERKKQSCAAKKNNNEPSSELRLHELRAEKYNGLVRYVVVRYSHNICVCRVMLNKLLKLTLHSSLFDVSFISTAYYLVNGDWLLESDLKILFP